MASLESIFFEWRDDSSTREVVAVQANGLYWGRGSIPSPISFADLLRKYILYVDEFSDKFVTYRIAPDSIVLFVTWIKGADLELYQRWLSMFENRDEIDRAEEHRRFCWIDDHYPKLPIEQKLLLIIGEHGGKSTPVELSLD